MLAINKIPHLKLYRQKMVLPYNPKESKKGSLVIANTRTFEGIEHILDNNKIEVKANYTSIYMDRHINTLVGKKSVIKNLKNEREEKYTNLKKLPLRPILKGVVENQLINAYNMFYDISTINDLFFTHTICFMI